MAGKRWGGLERDEPGVFMTEEDTRDNTADAHAQAAGGRSAVADNTAAPKREFHPHLGAGGGRVHPRVLRESRSPSVPVPFMRALPAQ
jgi:hypothetical protein